MGKSPELLNVLPIDPDHDLKQTTDFFKCNNSSNKALDFAALSFLVMYVSIALLSVDLRLEQVLPVYIPFGAPTASPTKCMNQI